jgi:paraquat-inducible protein B
LTELPAAQLAQIPEAVPVPTRRTSLPLVWIIPLVAALVGVTLAVKALLERGPEITITFASGEGLEAGKTRIKYRDLDVGLVESLRLSEDRRRVVVTARMAPQAAALLVEDTRFWVVRPRFAGGGVSGLGTVLSGAYIGLDAGQSQQSAHHYTGLEVPPMVTGDLAGRRFVLRGEDLGSLDIGAPVYFRRLQVGRVVALAIDKDGRGVTVTVFVNAPYDHYVGSATRFWHASGMDLTMGADGVRLDTESLTSIVLGGIAFATLPGAAGQAPAEDGAVFALHADRQQAMKLPDSVVQVYTLRFRESVRGLSVGAPVDFRGFAIGEVAAINIDYDQVRKDFDMAVEVHLYPERLRENALNRDRRAPPEDSASLLDAMVSRGFRAQLRTGNLLTGQLYIAIDFFPNAPPAKVDWSSHPPGLPTIPASLQELQETLSQIAKRLEKVPFDAIAGDLRQALQQLDRTLASTNGVMQRLDREVAPQAGEAIEEAPKTLGAAERMLAADAPVQQDLREALRELARAASALRALAETLERRPETLIRGKAEDGR